MPVYGVHPPVWGVGADTPRTGDLGAICAPRNGAMSLMPQGFGGYG